MAEPQQVFKRKSSFRSASTDSVNARNGNRMRMAGTFLGVDLNDISDPSGYTSRGPLFHNELKQIEILVKEIQTTWKTSGCSILIDGWRDNNGRQLMNVLVDCPKGATYLKSLDISAAIEDHSALILVFDEIIKEVGADNVVQVISNYTSHNMNIVGKIIMDKYPAIFWTVSATTCLETMLENIGRMGFNKNVLNNALMLTNFIYNRPTVLMLMRKYTTSRELVKSSKIKSTIRFLALENILIEKKNLEKMFSSSEWRSSVWSSSSDGKRIVEIVRDTLFWYGARLVLIATIPLVKAIHLIHEGAQPQIGFIYETMNQVKETIRDAFQDELVPYMPYWNAIDELWNNSLHSPLHSAAYFLNPLYRYSTDFEPDDEVMTNLHLCISHVVEEKKLQRFTRQFVLYEEGKGPFGREDAIQQSRSISSVDWWSCYSKECPELQSFAIKILSQTCDGASKYYLNKSLAEKLLTNGSDQIKQKLLKDLTFCYYNIQLREFLPGLSSHYCTIDPINHGIVDETFDREPTGMEVSSSRRAKTRLVEGSSDSAE